jgi:hypothetical protein
MVSEPIIENVKDAIAVCSTIIEAAEKEIAWLLPAPMLVLAAQYHVESKDLIQKGGRVRGITTISSPYVETVRELLDMGVDVRHINDYTGTFMLVADKSQSVSSFFLNVEDLSLDDKIVAFWTDNADYAEYLLSNFDMVWEDATDAQKRLNEI